MTNTDQLRNRERYANYVSHDDDDDPYCYLNPMEEKELLDRLTNIHPESVVVDVATRMQLCASIRVIYSCGLTRCPMDPISWILRSIE